MLPLAKVAAVVLALAWPACRAYVLTDTGLAVTTQVVPMSNGVFKVPPGTEYLAVEIGCSDRNTMDEDWLEQNPKGFLVSFEPLLDKYAILLARGTKRYHRDEKDLSVPLGHHHRRGIVLPFAVTPSSTGGNIVLNVSPIAGCSSTAKVKRTGFSGRLCKTVSERRLVDSLGLVQVLNMTRPKPIRILKIDAQGIDYALVRSVSVEFLRERVEGIRLETISHACRKLYDGQVSCEQVVAYMSSAGYYPDRPCSQSKDMCEVDVLFSRGPMPDAQAIIEHDH